MLAEIFAFGGLSVLTIMVLTKLWNVALAGNFYVKEKYLAVASAGFILGIMGYAFFFAGTMSLISGEQIISDGITDFVVTNNSYLVLINIWPFANLLVSSLGALFFLEVLLMVLHLKLGRGRRRFKR